MGFLSKLFRKKSVDIAVEPTSRTIENPECIKLLALKAYMNSLLSDNRYIPKSEYRAKLLDEKKVVEYFAVLENSGMLGSFCQTNGVDEKEIQDTFSCYSHFEELIDAHNDSYINRAMSEEKKYLDNILHDVDPQIKLDEDQRRVILTDEDYCLVIAGAGAGKTTTVAAKVKYLVEKKGVQPSQILVVSFTNKAVQELRDKLNKDLKIDCPIATFHSTGNAILRKQTDEKLNIKDIQDILINSQHAAKTYLKIPEAYAQIIKKGYWYEEYIANGGEQNSYFNDGTNTFETKSKDISKVMTFPFDAVSSLNNIVEMAPRLAEYIASREAGRSAEVSMLDAARVTTNFAAGGDFTKFLNRNGATFLNASVQGALQQVRNIREAKANGLKGWINLAAKYAAAGIPAMILNALLWGDDEEYEELSDYIKQNYYIVGKYGDGKFVRIPKGRTMAVIQDAFNQVANAVTGDDEVDLMRFLDLAVSNLAPNNPIDNNVLSPLVQVANNKTWYGEDLVSERLQDLPEAEQYDEGTDALSKWLGEKINYSPVKINYLLDQYSGGLGDVLLPMMTPKAESGDSTFGGKLIAPMKSKFTADSVMNNQNISDFYDLKDELTVNANASGATHEDILKNKYINSINADISDLYKAKREAQNSDLPDDEKYAEVRSIQKQINDLAGESMTAYKDIAFSGPYARVGKIYYKLSNKGEWEKLSDEQLEKLDISTPEYWSSEVENGSSNYDPENYTVAGVVGGFEAYKKYSDEICDINADKDSSGKTISGSRKEKVLSYINGLDLDYGQKLMLFKSEYRSDTRFDYRILEYLGEREDLSYEQTLSILTALGLDKYRVRFTE